MSPDPCRLGEWVGAINLLNGAPTASELPEEVRKDLDSAILFGGTNGWTESHEKNDARRKLVEHVRGSVLSPEAAGHIRDVARCV